jgi:hypothetical protein
LPEGKVAPKLRKVFQPVRWEDFPKQKVKIRVQNRKDEENQKNSSQIGKELLLLQPEIQDCPKAREPKRTKITSI